MMDGGQALDWVCSQRDWLVPVLAVILPASFLSAWEDKMPPWMKNVVNFLGANFGDIIRAYINSKKGESNDNQPS